MGLAHRDTLFAIIPAFSRISISSCTHCTCLRAKVYSLWVMGGLSPVGISIFKSGVFPKSAESLEKIVSNSETQILKCFSVFWCYFCIPQFNGLSRIYIHGRSDKTFSIPF